MLFDYHTNLNEINKYVDTTSPRCGAVFVYNTKMDAYEMWNYEQDCSWQFEMLPKYLGFLWLPS